MNYTKFSDVLALAQADQHYTLYRRMLKAVREGSLTAVPTPDTLEIPGKKGPFRVFQHLLQLPAEDVLKLLNKERPKIPKNAVTLADLEEGKIDFSEVAKKYRDSLQPRPKRGRRSKVQRGE